MSNDVAAWASTVTKEIFNVTFDRNEAEQSSWSRTYLKELAAELKEENGGKEPLVGTEVADRILIARLSLDPAGDVMSDDAEQLSILAGLPEGETTWDYLIGAYRRCKAAENGARKFGAPGQTVLDELRGLIISYLGLSIQAPDMFPNHTKKGSEARPKTLGPFVLVKSLLNLGSGAPDAYSSSASTSSGFSQSEWASLEAHETLTLLQDLAVRFGDEGLDEILGPAFFEVGQQIRRGSRVIVDGDGSAQDAPGGATAAAGGNPMQNPAIAAAAAAGDVQAVLAALLGQAGAAGMPGGAGGAAPAGAPSLGGRRNAREGMSILDSEWRQNFMSLIEACEIKEIAALLPSLPQFNPEDATGASIENVSLLGPILRLSSFADVSPSLAKTYFSGYEPNSDAGARAIQSAFTSTRSTLQIVHGLHFRLFNGLVRAGPGPRERVLAYWASAADKNKKRGAMRAQKETVATDGYTVNLFELLMRFSEPFMDASYSKIDRIDPEYLRTQSRFDVSDLTRLNATEQEAKEWTDNASSKTAAPNFITETFYLALRFANLGLGKAIRRFNDKAEDMRRLKKRAAEFEADRAHWSAGPQAAQFEAWIKKAKDDCDRMQAQLLAAEAQLLDSDFIARSVQFFSFVMNWLVRIADPKGQHPKTRVELPLPKQIPDVFRMLPEHIFEDVCEVLLFYARYKPDCLSQPAKDDLITFATTFLSSGWYVKNPFLKAKLAEILYYNVHPVYKGTPGVITDALHFHPLAVQHLIPALMTFWIEAESTGSHTQFYDKFNIRYHLASVFRVIWTNPEHKARLHKASETSEFVVFVNRLLNDVTFLLDDSLEKLVELHNKQLELDDPNNGTAEERQEREGAIRGIEGHIRSMLQFGHEFLKTLIDFTEDEKTKSGFMQPEIVSRLAPMLDYNLDMMVGSRCQELKVKDPKKVGFEPKTLLRQILAVYLNLAARPEFVQAVAKDERSYRKEIFEKAGRIAEKHMLKSPPELDVLRGFVGQVEQIKQMDAEEEEDLGEIPDDFCDPLMATLMREPVILPASKAIVDLSTIKSHLLSDSSDPFNRMPLKIEEVLPATELKAQIEAWLEERKEAKRQREKEAAAAQ